jgi:hypothetical protein
MPIDPLIEVSTDRGENMRETCARVLAAALMTAAIATVVGMPALFGGPEEPAAQIAAPPSSFVRSVRLVAQPAPRPKRAQPVRRVTTPVRPVVVAPSLVVIHTKRAPHQGRRLAAVKAPPVAAPVAEAVPLETPDPAVEPDRPGKGHGHAYGHDKHAE